MNLVKVDLEKDDSCFLRTMLKTNSYFSVKCVEKFNLTECEGIIFYKESESKYYIRFIYNDEMYKGKYTKIHSVPLNYNKGHRYFFMIGKKHLLPIGKYRILLERLDDNNNSDYYNFYEIIYEGGNKNKEKNG